MTISGRDYPLLGYFQGCGQSAVATPCLVTSEAAWDSVLSMVRWWLSVRLLCWGTSRPLECCSGTIAIGPQSVSRSVQKWSGSSQFWWGAAGSGGKGGDGAIGLVICKQPTLAQETAEVGSWKPDQNWSAMGLGVGSGDFRSRKRRMGPSQEKVGRGTPRNPLEGAPIRFQGRAGKKPPGLG